MRVLVAMSGGVDSSVAAAVLLDEGHSVVGATMKLWGGSSDSGCCSVADVDDARRVAQQLGIAHHVFNFSDDFDRHVVEPYVADHAHGRTPNPCIECNRHLKFDRFLERSQQLGFDAVATGHHARVVSRPGGRWALERGADALKDQSYVLHMLGQDQLARVLLPIGSMTKVEVRARASELGLRTAEKADSQDVCFISRRGGRQEFLAARIPLRPAMAVDETGGHLGELPAVELLTIGQRRGLGNLAVTPPIDSDDPPSRRSAPGRPASSPPVESPGIAPPDDGRRYVVAVEMESARVTVGPLSSLMTSEILIGDPAWVDGPPVRGEVLAVQMSAHGQTVSAAWEGPGRLTTMTPVRKVAPGQSVVMYRGDAVVGGGPAV